MKVEQGRHDIFSYSYSLIHRYAFRAITVIAISVTGFLASVSYSVCIQIRNSGADFPIELSTQTAEARAVSIESTQGSRINVDKEDTTEIKDPLVLVQSPQIESRDAETLRLAQAANRSAALEHSVSQEEGIQLIGIAIETNFQNDQYIQDIENLWRQYSESENLLSFPETLDDKTYVAYSNYSEDGNQFTISIGHRVANFENIPIGLRQISIPTSTYARFNVTGNLEEGIPKTWTSIELLNLDRAYTTDLEIYNYQNENMAEIWISVN